MLWIILSGCEIFRSTANIYEADFSEVKGQAGVKRALEVRVAGGHKIIMVGAPGSGTTTTGEDRISKEKN